MDATGDNDVKDNQKSKPLTPRTVQDSLRPLKNRGDQNVIIGNTKEVGGRWQSKVEKDEGTLTMANPQNRNFF